MNHFCWSLSAWQSCYFWCLVFGSVEDEALLDVETVRPPIRLSNMTAGMIDAARPLRPVLCG